MQSDPAYGQKFVSPFRVDSVSQLAVSGPKKSRLLVSRLRRDTPGHGLVMAPQQEGGPVYSVLLQLREQTSRELFVADKCVHRGSYAARTTSIVNHLERPVANLLSPFDNLMFTVPQLALDEIADERGVARVSQLHCRAGGVFDETVASGKCASSGLGPSQRDRVALCPAAHARHQHVFCSDLRRPAAGEG